MHYELRTFNLPEISGLSKKQLDVHIALYEGYVKHANLLSTELTRLASDPVSNAYLIGELRKRKGFEFNGMRLHEIYFESLEEGAMVINADSNFYSALVRQYGSFDKWITSFKALSGRGPGWALLDYDPVTGHFHHAWVEDHQVGQLAGVPVIFALDHWEHAFMVDYVPADKGKYVDAYLNNINWTKVAERFDRVVPKKI